jgi:hypothetical protein
MRLSCGRKDAGTPPGSAMNLRSKSSPRSADAFARLFDMALVLKQVKPAPRRVVRTVAGLTLLIASTTAAAVDGCQVLLCLAGSWRSIQQCVPPVVRVLKDLARGKAFPKCDLGGSGNSASHAWAIAPGNCPPQYTRWYDTESTRIYGCDYAGAITVTIDGSPFTRTWWNMAGDSVTEYTPAAKQRLGSWDTRFDDDLAIWIASIPPGPPLDLP